MGYDKINSYTDFYYVFFRNVLLVLLPVTIIIGLILSIPHSSANTFGSDNVTLNLSTSCIVNAVVTEEHVANLHGGQIDNDVGITKLSAFCNDNNGYSIYAIGSSNNIDSNTDLVNTVSESCNIRTGVYDDTLQTNSSSWAMKLTAGTGTGVDPTTGESVPTTPPTIVNGYNNYSAIPNIYTQVAKRTSGTSMTTDTSISGSYLETTYQIYANSAQPAGTYNGRVKYVIVHPNSNTTTLSDLESAFAMAGKQKYHDLESNYYYAMQDMDSNICNSITHNGEITATQLVDIRDSKLYWVTKLADGNCWMTQNLDLDLETTPNKVAALTSENTDLSLYGSMGYDNSNGYSCSNLNTTTNCTASGEMITWTPERSTIPEGNLSSTTWQNDNNNPYSYDNGLVAPNGVMDGHGYTGNYYNWTAAIASNNSSSYSTNNTIAANSICPKGWRLPNAASMTGGYEFSKLLYEYGVTTDNQNTAGYAVGGFSKIIASPLYFGRAGYLNTSSIYDLGSGGLYWSSVAFDNSYAFYLTFNSSNIRSNYNNFKSYGRSLRCLAK